MLFYVFLIQICCAAGFVTVSSKQQRDASNVLDWLDATPTSITASATRHDDDDDDDMTIKQRLLDLLASVPRNTVTSDRQTQEILDTVRDLEPSCPTPPDDVLTKSAGTWELVWTAQDRNGTCRDGPPLSPFRWINPLENQAYSNNPAGRANPILPVEIQNFLTDKGILSSVGPLDDDDDDGDENNNNNNNNNNKESRGRTSTQTIDLKNQRVINVVSVPLAGQQQQRAAALTVRVDFTPHPPDPRRVNVKFQSFRVSLGDTVRLELPLGIIGPTGWLRTTYLDDTLRITRGHKGSVFVLQRRRAKKRNPATADTTTTSTTTTSSMTD